MTQIRAKSLALAALFAPALVLAGCVAEQPAPATAPVMAHPPVPAAAPPDPAAKARTEARVAARLQELEPEFWTRRARDGEAAANAWLQRRAVEIGREEAAREATG